MAKFLLTDQFCLGDRNCDHACRYAFDFESAGVHVSADCASSGEHLRDLSGRFCQDVEDTVVQVIEQKDDRFGRLSVHEFNQ